MVFPNFSYEGRDSANLAHTSNISKETSHFTTSIIFLLLLINASNVYFRYPMQRFEGRQTIKGMGAYSEDLHSLCFPPKVKVLCKLRY